jgi:PAS domain S-box-containing protein
MHSDEVRMISKNGDVKWISWSATPLMEEGVLYAIGRDVSERRKANDFTKLILESIQDHFYVLDEDFRFTYINQSAEVLINEKKEDLLGKCIWDVFPVLREGSFYTRAIESMETMKPVHFEFYSDVVETYFEESFYPSKNGMSVFFRSINERKEAEQELENQKYFFEQIFMQSAISSQMIGVDGSCQKVNPKMAALFGLDPKEIENGKYNLLKDPEIIRRGIDVKIRKVIDEKITLEWECPFDMKASAGVPGLPNGQYRPLWVYFTAFPLLNKSGGLSHIIIKHQDISERKRTEEALLISNERFEYVTRATFDAIWDSDLVNDTVYWGEGCYTLFGYTPEDLQKMKMAFKDFLAIQDKDRVSQTFKDALDGDALNWMEEYQFRKADGTYAYVQDRAIITRNKDGKAIRATGAMQDITRQKMEEGQLKLRESVITNSTDSILIAEVNPEDELKPILVFINEAFTRMTGFNLDEIKVRNQIFVIGPNTDEFDVGKLNEALRNKKQTELEVISYKKNGEEFWVYLSLIPVFNARKELTHWISIQRDTSSRRKRDNEREQLVRELMQSNKELKQFSYITSHNMRSPLTNLTAISELLDMSKIEDETTKELLEGFKISTGKLNDTLNDLIEILVMKETEKIEVDMVSFAEVSLKVQASISTIIKKSDALIHTNFNSAPSVQFNPAYLESIFLNLITNSIKYARKDKKPIIFIYSVVGDDSIQLIFEDNGLGFNLSKVQHKIFGLYQKFHNHPDSKGIGLYLVHSQVTSLGGTIEVESEDNEGTKFIINFPIKP